MPLNFKFPESANLVAIELQENPYEARSQKQLSTLNTNKDDTSDPTSAGDPQTTVFHSQVNFDDVNLILPINDNSKTKLIGMKHLLNFVI